jgi:two-component system sensor histidine kinase YesM
MKPTILTKLLISLFLIVIPLYTINFVLNNIGARANMKEMERNMERSAYSFHRLIEAEVQQITKMMTESAINIALLKVERSKMSAIRSADVLDIQRITNDVQRSSRFIKQTTLYLPGYNAMVTYNAYSSQMDLEVFRRFSEAPALTLTTLGEDGVYLVYPYMVRSRPESSFILAVELNEPSLRYLMRDVNGYDQGGAVLFNAEQQWHFGSQQQEEFYRDLIAAYMKADGPRTTRSLTVHNTRYTVSADESSLLGTTMLVYTPQAVILKETSSYREIFRWMLAASFVIIVGVSIWIYRTVHSPLRVLVKAMRDLEHESSLQLTSQVRPEYEDEFGYIYHRFNITISKLKESIHNLYVTEIERQRAELKRLQSQIDPHFLYNTFFVLSRLIRREDIGTATKFAQFLGRYFQYITRNDSDEIPLFKEIEHARAYAEIQMVCYPQIHVRFSDPEEIGNISRISVPRLILQPLLENCYKHGFKHSYTNGKIKFSMEQAEGYLVFKVEDNGSDVSGEDLIALRNRVYQGNEIGTGLVNVHRRVSLRFKGDSGLGFSRSEELGGLQVTLRIRIPAEGTDYRTDEAG